MTVKVCILEYIQQPILFEVHTYVMEWGKVIKWSPQLTRNIVISFAYILEYIQLLTAIVIICVYIFMS